MKQAVEGQLEDIMCFAQEVLQAALQAREVKKHFTNMGSGFSLSLFIKKSGKNRNFKRPIALKLKSAILQSEYIEEF